jgi:hypothetical protein
MSSGNVTARTALTALCVKLGEDEVARALGVSVGRVLAWSDDISEISGRALLGLEEMSFLITSLSDLGYGDAAIRRWFLEAKLARGTPLELVARGEYSDADELRAALGRAEKRAHAATSAGLPLPPLA